MKGEGMDEILDAAFQDKLEANCEDARMRLNSLPIDQIDLLPDGGLMESYQAYRAALAAYQNAKAELDAFMSQKERQANPSAKQQ